MATATRKVTLNASRDIPFNKLLLSQSNVRRVKAGISIDELAEDIALVVGRLAAALLKGEELIAQVYESRACTPAAELEVEQSAVKCQRLIDVADFKSDMIETDGACFPCLNHGCLRCPAR
jgi:hypothetical protein